MEISTHTKELTTAPVALFVFDRLGATRKTLEALLANTMARDTDLLVFSDGGRDKASWRRVERVRRLLRKVKAEAVGRGLLRSMEIVERPRNVFVEANIRMGVEQTLAGRDRVIALEDDIVTSPHFLRYMNEALELYKDVAEVVHVSGFTNLSLDRGRDFYFTPHMSGWGWATWRDRWQESFVAYGSRAEALEGMTARDCDAVQYGGVFPCLRSLDKSPIPWDVCWELAIYKRGGLCLTPSHTLVRNIGLGSGTHFRSCRLLQSYEYDRPPLARPIRLERVDKPEAEEATERLFAEAIKDWGIRYTPLGKALRRLYKRMRP